MKIFKDEPRPGEIYAYRTRKPWFTLVSWLRHWGYAGQTRNPAARDSEHRTGTGRYGPREPATWSDLDPVRYVVWKSARIRNWRLNLIEWIVIKCLLPVYNHQHNLTNPRRVSRVSARAMRSARDAGVPRWVQFRPGHALQLMVLLSLAWACARFAGLV